MMQNMTEKVDLREEKWYIISCDRGRICSFRTLVENKTGGFRR